jgi:hypothetical protein
MDAFEQIVSELLWMEGYWVQRAVKVKLTSEEKRLVGKPSMPRPEIDILAFSSKRNLLRVVECKSYLDSKGVSIGAFEDPQSPAGKRYKLFNNATLRRVVINRLRKQLIEIGACRSNVKIELCLVCGRISSDAQRPKLRKLFERKGWHLLEEDWLRRGLRRMSEGGYENQVSALVAKLLLRKQLDRDAIEPEERLSLV